MGPALIYTHVSNLNFKPQDLANLQPKPSKSISNTLSSTMSASKPDLGQVAREGNEKEARGKKEQKKNSSHFFFPHHAILPL
jgi:hypothetical protein